MTRDKEVYFIISGFDSSERLTILNVYVLNNMAAKLHKEKIGKIIRKGRIHNHGKFSCNFPIT